MLTSKKYDDVSSCLKKTIEHYVPNYLHKLIHFGENNIKIDPQFLKRMMKFENADEFFGTMLNFRAISGGLTYFCSDPTEPSVSRPDVYKSLRHNEYTFNHSIVEFLDDTLPMYMNEPCETKFCWSIIGYYLRVKQSQLGNNFHLVPHHPELFEELRKRIAYYPVCRSNDDLSKEEAFEQFKKILPVTDMDPEFKSVLKTLNKYDEMSTLKQRPYIGMYVYIGAVIAKFEKFLENYPKPDKNTPIVRLFEDEKNKFVLAHELLESMEKAEMDIHGIKERIGKMEKLQTIPFNDLRLNGEQMKKIEFVRTPIDRTEYRVIYNPSFDGNFCIPTGDFLLETIKEAISIKWIFQVVTKEKSIEVFKLFQELVKVVSKESKNCYFVDVKIAEKIKLQFFEKLDVIMDESRQGIKLIRNIGSQRFTMKGLRNEVLYLGIHDIFPDILDRCKEAYEIFIEPKPVKKLKSLDLYNAIEYMQLGSLMKMVPTVLGFFHFHKLCSTLCASCPYCNGTFSLVENLEETDEKQDKAVGEEPTQSPSDEKKNKRKEKKNRQAERKKQAREQAKVEAKEEVAESSESVSSVCEKCYRTSQKCTNAKEELKQEKNKNKALNKELANVLLELELAKKREMEKDEKIRVLKEKLATSEEMVQNFQNHQSENHIGETPEAVTDPEASDSKPNMMEVLIKLLDIKDVLPESKKKATDQAEELLNKTTEKKYRDLVETEMDKYRSDYSVYYQYVEEHIQSIRKNPNERIDFIRLLPNHPELSQKFYEAYDNIVKKKELEDGECIICLEIMNNEKETVQCGTCTTRYHMSCAWEWSRVKNGCAVCEKEIEFPRG